MIAAVKAIIENGNRVTAWVLLLLIVAGLAYLVYALATGKIPSPGDYKRLAKDHEDLKAADIIADDTLQKAREELADSRVLHARAVARIEYLEIEQRRKDAEIADLKARLAERDAELSVLRREQWQRHSSPEGD